MSIGSRTVLSRIGLGICLAMLPGSFEAGAQESTEVASEDAREDSTAAFRLSEGEVDRALAVAERSMESADLRDEGPLYHVATELELAKHEGAETGARLARVVHYRYAGDLRIETVVDLASGRIVRQDAAPHLPTRLASEEVRRVAELVLAEPRVREAAGRGIASSEVVPMVFSPPPGSPLFGRRAVLANLRQEERFLNLPFVIYVDLTESRVILEERVPEAEHH